MRLYDDCSLQDVLRHEYGHAVADLYPRLIRSWRFRWAFGGRYHDEQPASDYHPKKHVTEYAATLPMEDFSEVFTYYVKHNGTLPRHFNTAAIRRKWKYVARLVRIIHAERRCA